MICKISIIEINVNCWIGTVELTSTNQFFTEFHVASPFGGLIFKKISSVLETSHVPEAIHDFSCVMTSVYVKAFHLSVVNIACGSQPFL